MRVLLVEPYYGGSHRAPGSFPSLIASPPTRFDFLVDLDDQGITLTAATAQGRAAQATASGTDGVDQRHHDPRSRSSKGMAEGDRSPVDIDLFMCEIEQVRRVERNRGVGLIDLDEVEISGGEVGPFQRDLQCFRGASVQAGIRSGGLPVGNDLGKDRKTGRLGGAAIRNYEGGGAV